MDPESTEELIAKARGGCSDSFGILVETCKVRLETLIKLRLWSPLREKVDPQDVFQETCLKAFQSVSRFEARGNDAFFHWLAGIAEHVILNLSRKLLGSPNRPREVALDAEDGDSSDTRPLDHGFTAPGPSPSDPARDQERFDRFKAALSGLRKDYQEVIILTLAYRLNTREIAERMGRTRDAVSMLLLRAVRSLRLLLSGTEILRFPPTCLESLRKAHDDQLAMAGNVGGTIQAPGEVEEQAPVRPDAPEEEGTDSDPLGLRDVG